MNNDLLTLVFRLNKDIEKGKRNLDILKPLRDLHRLVRSQGLTATTAMDSSSEAADQWTRCLYHLASLVLEAKTLLSCRAIAAELLRDESSREPRILIPSFRGYERPLLPTLLPLLASLVQPSTFGANLPFLVAAVGPSKQANVPDDVTLRSWALHSSCVLAERGAFPTSAVHELDNTLAQALSPPASPVAPQSKFLELDGTQQNMPPPVFTPLCQPSSAQYTADQAMCTMAVSALERWLYSAHRQPQVPVTDQLRETLFQYTDRVCAQLMSLDGPGGLSSAQMGLNADSLLAALAHCCAHPQLLDADPARVGQTAVSLVRALAKLPPASAMAAHAYVRVGELLLQLPGTTGQHLAPGAVLQPLCGQLGPQLANHPFAAFEILHFISLQASTLARKSSVFGQHWPFLLRLVAAHPRLLAADGQHLAPFLAHAACVRGPAQTVELAHALLDFPLIASAQERSNTGATGNHTSSHKGTGLTDDADDDDSEDLVHWQSSAAAADNCSSRKGNGSSSGGATSSTRDSMPAPFDSAATSTGAAATDDSRFASLFNLLLRSESGLFLDLWQDGSSTLPLLVDFCASHAFVSARVRAACGLVPSLIEPLFATVPAGCVEDMFAFVLARFYRLFPSPSYTATVQQLLADHAVQLVRRRPDLLVHHRFKEQIEKLIQQPCRQRTTRGDPLLLAMIWSVGAFLAAAVPAPADNNNAPDESASVLSSWLEIIEMKALETVAGLTPACPATPYQSRLLIVIVQSVTKLVGRCPEFVGRASLFLCKLLHQPDLLGPRVTQITQEMLSLLDQPHSFFNHANNDGDDDDQSAQLNKLIPSFV